MEEMAHRMQELEAERADLAKTVKKLAEEKEKLENEEKALTTNIETRKRKMRGLKRKASVLHNGDIRHKFIHIFQYYSAAPKNSNSAQTSFAKQIKKW